MISVTGVSVTGEEVQLKLVGSVQEVAAVIDTYATSGFEDYVLIEWDADGNWVDTWYEGDRPVGDTDDLWIDDDDDDEELDDEEE